MSRPLYRSLILASLSLASLSLACSLLACSGPAEPPVETETVLEIVGEIADGAPRDIAIGASTIWVAQGRALAAIDPATGARLEDHPASPFEAPLVSVAEIDGDLYVASESELRIFEAGGAERSWRESRMGRIRDLALLAGEGGAPSAAVVVTRNRLVHLDLSGAEITELGSALAPSELASFSRAWVTQVGGNAFAILTGDLNAYPGAGQRGLVVASLGAEGAEPAFLATWDPAVALAVAGASTEDLVIREETIEGSPQTVLYLACGLGQLAKLGLADPAAPALLETIPIREGASLFGVAGEASGPLSIFSEGRIDRYDPEAGAPLMGSDIELSSGALRWALGPSSAGPHLWLASSAEQRFPVQSFALSGAEAPSSMHRLGWIVRGRGVAAAPEWSRVYVPTAGGVLSYDLSDPSAPRPVAGSYQPGEGGSVTQLSLFYPDEADPSEAMLLSAMEEGGVALWSVRASAPEPGAPLALPHLPEGWEGAAVRQSDVAVYRDGSDLYLLAAIANRDTDQSALMAYDLGRERWLVAAETNDALTADSGAIAVRGQRAFVVTAGGLFEVDLEGLPERLSVASEHLIGAEAIGAPATIRGAAAAEGALYFGLDQPGGFLVYGYGEDGGIGGEGQIDARTSATIPGNTGRLRLDPGNERMMVPARSGNLWVMDTSEVTRLHLVTRWSHPYYTGDIADARPLLLGDEHLLLVSKEREGFSLLRFATVPVND